MNLYVHEVGPSTSPTIVLLHGGGAGGWMWQPQVEKLSREYHCLVPDLPEHGKSIDIGPITIPGSADLVADLIRTRAHGGKAHVVGLSLGAQVTVALLGIASELVDHAIVSSASLRPVLPGNWMYSKGMMRAVYWSSIAPFQKWDAYIRLNMKYAAGIPDQYFPYFRESFRQYTANAWANLMAANMGYRLPSGLERANCPVLVIVGQKEYASMQQSARDLLSVLPNAAGYTVAHAEKWSMVEEHNWSLKAPELFTKTVKSWIEDEQLPEQLVPLRDR